jgi:hypothetical protein
LALIKVANLAVRFVLELSALIVLGAWEYSVGGGWAAKVGLAVGVPVAAAVIWGTFVSPRAAVPVPGTVQILLQVLIFGAAAVALVQLGHRLPSGVFGLVAVGNAALMAAWHQ